MWNGRDDKSLRYQDFDKWRIYGQGVDNQLNIRESSFLQHFGMALDWIYSVDNKTYPVTIKCILTASPTSDPTVNPTSDPTTVPTADPTRYPTADPTQNPTMEPSRHPTKDPTDNPSADPTIDPTADPTTNPSAAPSFLPSAAPSNAPTSPPSRAPTSISDYDSFMNATYLIQGMVAKDIVIWTDTFYDSVWYLTNLLEYAYVNHQSNDGFGGWKLNYYDFYVNIRAINGFPMQTLFGKSRPDIVLAGDDCIWSKGPCFLQFEATIFCEEAICIYLERFYDQQLFEEFMTIEFDRYVRWRYQTANAENVESDDDIIFSVLTMSEALLLNPQLLKPKWFELWYYWICIVVGLFFFSLCVFVKIHRYRVKRIRFRKAMNVYNPLVLCIAIGKYGEFVPRDALDIDEVGGFMSDLDGIQHDKDHMDDLFGNRLGYDIFPLPVQNGERPKNKWTQKDLKDFLETKAKFLSANIGKGRCYDGLILIVSCHGISGYLCTSDYKIYSKVAVHRTFSMFSNLREIPRFILFDCCQGADAIERAEESWDLDAHKAITSESERHWMEFKKIRGGDAKNVILL